MGEYVFYIEIDGNVREERVKAALDFLRNSVEVYSLGSYRATDVK
jgi:prephenate dehydratase